MRKKGKPHKSHTRTYPVSKFGNKSKTYLTGSFMSVSVFDAEADC